MQVHGVGLQVFEPDCLLGVEMQAEFNGIHGFHDDVKDYYTSVSDQGTSDA